MNCEAITASERNWQDELWLRRRFLTSEYHDFAYFHWAGLPRAMFVPSSLNLKDWIAKMVDEKIIDLNDSNLCLIEQFTHKSLQFTCLYNMIAWNCTFFSRKMWIQISRKNYSENYKT